MRHLTTAAAFISLATLLASTRRVEAQEHPHTVPELRLDATSARTSRIDVSAGAVVPIGIYVRLALTAGAGLARQNGLASTAGRGDAIVRFELDPLKQHLHGAYLGGGLSLLGRDGPHVRAYLALVGGLELKQRHGWVPSVEAGLGGGARVGVSIRRAMERWR